MLKGKRETVEITVRTRHCDCGVERISTKNICVESLVFCWEGLLFHEEASVRKPAVLLVRELSLQFQVTRF